MSIFKETLPKYIIDQLTIREAIVKRGNNVSSNSMDPRTSKSRVELKGSGKKVDIDSNAFFPFSASVIYHESFINIFFIEMRLLVSWTNIFYRLWD